MVDLSNIYVGWAIEQINRHPYGCGCEDCVQADEALLRVDLACPEGTFELASDAEIDAMAGMAPAQAAAPRSNRRPPHLLARPHVRKGVAA